MTGLPPPAPPELRGRPLTDGHAVVLAAVVAAGAWTARAVPLPLAALVVVAALAWRRPWLLCAGGFLLASTLGARSLDGLRPAGSAPYRGVATLVTDPEEAFGGARAIVRVGHRRLELSAHGGAAGSLRARLAGEQIRVVGRIRPPPPDAPWLAVRHVVGRLEAAEIEPLGPGAPPWRAANRLRRTLVAGAGSLDPTPRSLYTGLVLGDDRDQPPTLADDFRGAGLTHLLAVSGQNVAFVLALAAPALRRLRLTGRWAATIGLIAGFALLTRFEPSVLRASAMAAVGATAVAIGRPAATARVLALAVAGLILIDPLLVRSLGFQLSVAASAGIVALAPRLAALIPGPRPLADALAITGAAQLGVGPILVAAFDGVPVASLPANLLAGPAAGLVMMWGLPAGLVAGVAGEPLAEVLHLPTRLLLGWIEIVARRAAAAPLGELGAPGLGVIAVGLAALAAGVRYRHPPLRWLGTVAAVAALVAPAVGLRQVPPGRQELLEGLVLWRAGGATVVEVHTAPAPDSALEALRRAGVRRVDAVVSATGGSAAADLVAAVRHRWSPILVLAPGGHEVPGAVTPAVGDGLRFGDLRVRVDAVRPRLVAAVGRGPPS